MMTTQDSERIAAEDICAMPLCHGLDTDEQETIAGLCSRRTLDDSTMIVEEGDMERDMYVLLDGAIEVFKRDDDGEQRCIARISPNAILGEVGLVLDEPRTATMIARGKTVVIEIDGQGFLDLIDQGALCAYKVAFNVLCSIAERQRATNEEIVRLMDESRRRAGPAGNDVAELRDKIMREWSF